MFGIQRNELTVLTEFEFEELDPSSEHAPAEKQKEYLQSRNG